MALIREKSHRNCNGLNSAAHDRDATRNQNNYNPTINADATAATTTNTNITNTTTTTTNQSSKEHLILSLKRVTKHGFHSHPVAGNYLNYNPWCFVRAGPSERGSWDMRQFSKVG